ncbi:hypothetical protein WMY93_013725, partial [Mugilogobius chulae]
MVSSAEVRCLSRVAVVSGCHGDKATLGGHMFTCVNTEQFTKEVFVDETACGAPQGYGQVPLTLPMST